MWRVICHTRSVLEPWEMRGEERMTWKVSRGHCLSVTRRPCAYQTTTSTKVAGIYLLYQQSPRLQTTYTNWVTVVEALFLVHMEYYSCSVPLWAFFSSACCPARGCYDTLTRFVWIKIESAGRRQPYRNFKTIWQMSRTCSISDGKPCHHQFEWLFYACVVWCSSGGGICRFPSWHNRPDLTLIKWCWNRYSLTRVCRCTCVFNGLYQGFSKYENVP